MSALEQLEKFEGRSSERTWLTAILKNKIIDVYRKRTLTVAKRSSAVELNEHSNGFFEPQNGHWKEAHQPSYFGIEDFDPLANKELNGILKSCMQKLPALWLAVFTMKHMDDDDTALICKQEANLKPEHSYKKSLQEVIDNQIYKKLRRC